MSISYAKLLREDTLLFWTISSIFNGRLKAVEEITVEFAIKQLNYIIVNHTSEHPINKRALNLLNEVVHYNTDIEANKKQISSRE